ncbi:hypothetical protein [Nitrolancea hollandica]|uniref:Uncharacterized protein n=1 Tax=Nitrolancea hollandica Lb TaxID=1129897 RepID=I4ELX6_9BACT|nr:hypothetical protein [Nitrolancea hollandica]CCF85689.1 exported hypothetical protein [Nitrolancea hollandica Lb]
MLRRLALATTFGFLALLFAVLPASAGLVWCQGDPIVSLNGTRVQIIVAIPADDQPRVTGPIQVDIGTPASVNRKLISTDSGFNNHGEKVTFRDTKGGFAGSVFPVEVSVSIPVDASRSGGGSDIPVNLTIITKNADPLLVYGTAARTGARINVPSTS